MPTKATAKATPRKAPAKAPATPPVEQVPASAPVRVEIRIGGRVRFADSVYDPQLSAEDGAVEFTASMTPTMVDAPAVRPPVQFFSDQRNGEEVITQVHSGRRT
jgi:hypothetical protein